MADFPKAYNRPPPPHRPYSTKPRAEGKRAGCLALPATLIHSPARYFFASRDIFGVADPKLQRLGLVRSTLGLFVTVVASYLLNRNGAGTARDQLTASIWAVFKFGTISMAVSIVILALRQRGGKQPHLRHLLIPIYTYLLTDALFAAMFVSIFFYVSLAAIFPPLALLAVPVVLWWMAFLATCYFYIVRDVFRAADANPLLAPVLSAMMPLLAFLDGFLPTNHSEGGGIPGRTGTLISVSGIVSTVALAFIEIRRLRGKHGITTRDSPPVPGKQRPPRSAPPPYADPWRQPIRWRQPDQPPGPWGPPPSGDS